MFTKEKSHRSSHEFTKAVGHETSVHESAVSPYAHDSSRNNVERATPGWPRWSGGSDPAPSAGGLGLIPGQGTQSYAPQLKVPSTVTKHSQIITK